MSQVEETGTSIKKLNNKNVFCVNLNVRSLSQNFKSLKELLNTIKFEFKLICLTDKWCTDDPRNEALFNLENYTSINKLGKMAEEVVYAPLITIL